MQRVVTAKRSVALAVAGLVVGTVGAFSVPALASSTDGHRSVSAPAVTLDYTGGNDEASVANAVGTGFGGVGVVKDTDGNVIGKTYDQCDKDSITPTSVEAFCTGLIKEGHGDQLSFAVAFPIPNSATAYPNSFTGVITGGTGKYDGASGEAKFTARSAGVYDLNFQ